MSDALVLESTGARADGYRAVDKLLGLAATAVAGDWPAGPLTVLGRTNP